MSDLEKIRGEAFAYTCQVASACAMASSVAAMFGAGTVDLDTALKMIRQIEADLKYHRPSFLREAEPGNLKEAPWGRPAPPARKR